MYSAQKNDYNQPIRSSINQNEHPSATNDDYDPYETQGLGRKLSENSRMGFIRKVMGILCAQLVFTAAGVVFSVVYSNELEYFFATNSYLLWMALTVNIICMYALGCYRSIARNVPTNYILLGIFTATMTFIAMAVTCQYEGESILIAAVITAMAVIGLMFYAVTTKRDFTLCGALMWAFVLISMSCLFLSFIFRNRVFQIIISGIAIVMVCFYIVLDTQLIIGNKRNSLEVDEYIFAAMMLYVDIVRLFLEILRILGNHK